MTKTSDHILLAQLAKEIRRGNVALFVGAGLSIGAGLPGWVDLVSPLAATIGYSMPSQRRHVTGEILARILQYYENALGRRELVDYIISQTDTSGIEPTENHILLSALNIQTWITTNYDDLLERTLRMQNISWRPVVCDENLPYMDANILTLVKMHGDRERTDTLIITESDYESYFLKRPLLRSRLTSLLLDRTLLFVGYSLDDPDFNQLRAEVSFYLKEHTRWAYAVMPHLDARAADNMRCHHIHVLGNYSDKHTHPSEVLQQVLEELVDEALKTQPRNYPYP